ncbi:hypothetical protein PR048_007535 [Dryococelus australis]|uniref:Uncharacterized protein n=1 Tax=Dryococelus australis TaxID=614101 RepID=A0ABQ9HUJ1_9NEOP|nr:hypothetical protein PR048_007535 [Dryococelus australis]
MLSQVRSMKRDFNAILVTPAALQYPGTKIGFLAFCELSKCLVKCHMVQHCQLELQYGERMMPGSNPRWNMESRDVRLRRVDDVASTAFREVCPRQVGDTGGWFLQPSVAARQRRPGSEIAFPSFILAPPPHPPPLDDLITSPPSCPRLWRGRQLYDLLQTERDGAVVSSLDSYSGEPGFDSRSGHPECWDGSLAKTMADSSPIPPPRATCAVSNDLAVNDTSIPTTYNGEGVQSVCSTYLPEFDLRLYNSRRLEIVFRSRRGVGRGGGGGSLDREKPITTCPPLDACPARASSKLCSRDRPAVGPCWRQLANCARSPDRRQTVIRESGDLEDANHIKTFPAVSGSNCEQTLPHPTSPATIPLEKTPL